jgi:hypothetical protein
MIKNGVSFIVTIFAIVDIGSILVMARQTTYKAAQRKTPNFAVCPEFVIAEFRELNGDYHFFDLGNPTNHQIPAGVGF